jgi:hypothetical protein
MDGLNAGKGATMYISGNKLCKFAPAGKFIIELWCSGYRIRISLLRIRVVFDFMSVPVLQDVFFRQQFSAGDPNQFHFNAQ